MKLTAKQAYDLASSSNILNELEEKIHSRVLEGGLTIKEYGITQVVKDHLQSLGYSMTPDPDNADGYTIGWYKS